MVRNVNKKADKKLLILMLVVIVLIIINLILFTKKSLQPKHEENNNQTEIGVEEEKKSEEVVVPKTEEDVIKMLSGYKERDRMEYYCGQYFKHIEKKEYEAAYNLLYDDFKQNYFSTIDEFKDYIEKTYPHEFALDYDDITRQGDIYVLRLKILDVLGSRENEKIQRIVIRENNYNDFVISFQVI
jgi:hypothetical protein